MPIRVRGKVDTSRNTCLSVMKVKINPPERKREREDEGGRERERGRERIYFGFEMREEERKR